MVCLNQRFEVLIGGGDAPEIHLDLLVAAHADDLLFLQHPQQIRLCLETDVADLVQEDAAAVGHFEFALLAVLRAGERAFLVAEQLALQQGFRERAAMGR
jgi:hypothetical protein